MASGSKSYDEALSKTSSKRKDMARKKPASQQRVQRDTQAEAGSLRSSARPSRDGSRRVEPRPVVPQNRVHEEVPSQQMSVEDDAPLTAPRHDDEPVEDGHTADAEMRQRQEETAEDLITNKGRAR